MSDMISPLGAFTLQEPCPASIWLLGAPAPCHKPKDHDGDHEIVIQWRVS